MALFIIAQVSSWRCYRFRIELREGRARAEEERENNNRRAENEAKELAEQSPEQAKITP